MNALQAALRAGATPEQLSRDLSIAVKPHPAWPHLLMFKYSQVASDFRNPVVQACRGVILDSSDDWKVVAWSFNKFFNHGDPMAAELDWDSAVVQQKVDGSLIQMYHYAGAWHVATSGLPDAGGKVNGWNKTFGELFWDTFKAQGLLLPDEYDHDPEESPLRRDWSRFTFSWELTTPLNRVVVDHRESKVTLLGMRDRVRGIECGVHQGPAAWPKVKHYPLHSLEATLTVLGQQKGLADEGFVAVDKHWNRVKFKNDDYLRLHHLRGNGNPTPKRALDVILNGETAEILASFPEWRPLFDAVGQRLCDMVSCLEAWHEEARERTYMCSPDGFMTGDFDPKAHPAAAQKIFAQHAVKSPCPGALFALRAGKVGSIREFFQKCMSLDNTYQVLKLAEIEPKMETVIDDDS